MEHLIQLAQDELVQKYNPHTIILYGSRARDDATNTSDIDIACFCDDCGELKDARLFHDVYLDAWVYPTSAMSTVSDDALRFGDGVVLLDKFGHGERYLALVRKRLADGPKKLSEADSAHLKEWVNKMLSHASADSPGGHYRRTWLQVELLEVYFQIRDLWFLGHKKSFMYFRDHDPKAMELFSHVYKNPTDGTALTALAKYVTASG